MPHHAKAMLDTYPRPVNVDTDQLAKTIDAVFECTQTCTACAAACLAEEHVKDLVKCIRLNLDCADVCEMTGRVISRPVEYDAAISRAVLEACVQACKSCGDECEAHGTNMEHCRVCAESCRRCEEACRDLLAAMGGA